MVMRPSLKHTITLTVSPFLEPTPALTILSRTMYSSSSFHTPTSIYLIFSFASQTIANMDMNRIEQRCLELREL